MNAKVEKLKSRAEVQQMLGGVSRSKMIEIENEMKLTKYKFSENSRLVYYDVEEVFDKLQPVNS